MERLWLIEKRKSRGLSQAAVAAFLNISQQAYGLYEKGIRTPKPSKAKIIGKRLNLDWTLFYEDNEVIH